MSRFEALHTRLGEMLDLVDCYAIAHGANPKQQALTDYDDAINVR